MAQGLLEMKSRPYRTSNLFDIPVDEGTRGTLVPFGLRDGEFSFAVPQAVVDAASAAYGVGDIGKRLLFDGEAVSGEEMMNAAINYGANFATPQAVGSLLMRPDPNALASLTPARKQRIFREVDKAKDTEAAQSLYTNLKNQGDIIGTPVEKTKTNILEDKKTVDLEGLLGKTFIPVFADRTSTGELISGIGDMPLSYDIITDGGVNFMRRKDASGIFASEPAAVSRIRGKVKELNEQDINPLGIYMSMGGDGLDFSTMALDTVISAMPAAKVLKKDIKDFDNDIRTKEITEAGKKRKIDPNWPGINSPNVREYMLGMNGTTRALVMKELAKGKRQQQGFPDIGRIRRALTDDELLFTPNAFGGKGIFEFAPAAPEVQQYGFRHPTYSEQFSGDYVGGLPIDVPKSILFRDLADMYMDDAGDFLMNPNKGKFFNDSQFTRSIFTKLAPQRVDDQMLEEYDFYKQSLLGK
jgi:hypothetical protein